MGDPKGFLTIRREENPLRRPAERLGDFADLHRVLGEKERRLQASRCMNCGVPFCQSEYGCPLHNRIPEWNDLLFRGFEKEAFERLAATAPFPEFTGRVCPALCEKACQLETDGVTNRDNERYLIEKAFANGWIRPRVPAFESGKRAAVIGSGPAGLAAADRLRQRGHAVTVFERADRPGGLLMYGIPAMKLPKEIVKRRIRLMEEEGIRFVTDTEPGPADVRDYDAVILCGGSRTPRALSAAGADAAGVVYAVDYLTAATKAVLAGGLPAISAEGKDVIVVGGGDTGNDCVGTALRQECRFVRELEMMPALPQARTGANPWPEWPRVQHTDYGQEEAAFRQGEDVRRYQTTVKAVRKAADGSVTAVQTVGLVRGAAGRMEEVPGSEQEMPCQLLIIAAGFVGCEEKTAAAFSLTRGERETLMPADGSHHLRGKFFAAGDMRTGQSLVVRAAADGRAAAEEADAWLMKQP